MGLPRYITVEKNIGETPLEALSRARAYHYIPPDIPLAYAGRLDPMAEGALLILVGETCKVQERYHSLDKAYTFDILLGIGSDTHDTLGIVYADKPITPSKNNVNEVLSHFTGELLLPYPHFSSRTVKGKPLHVWTLEKRLHEIEIPKKKSNVYKLKCVNIQHVTCKNIFNKTRENIARVTPVTDERKELGRDFRRIEVLASWEQLYKAHAHTPFTIVTLSCIASSGTYMRSLAHEIGKKLGTSALASHIQRTRIGRYIPFGTHFGFWIRTYAQDKEKVYRYTHP